MNEGQNFNKIYWFIVLMTAFGMFFTIYLLIRFKGEVAERFADQSMMFWLSTAVSGGIGYLIGNSMNKSNSKPPTPGTTTVDISATATTESKETPTEESKP